MGMLPASCFHRVREIPTLLDQRREGLAVPAGSRPIDDPELSMLRAGGVVREPGDWDAPSDAALVDEIERQRQFLARVREAGDDLGRQRTAIGINPLPEQVGAGATTAERDGSWAFHQMGICHADSMLPSVPL